MAIKLLVDFPKKGGVKFSNHKGSVETATFRDLLDAMVAVAKEDGLIKSGIVNINVRIYREGSDADTIRQWFKDNPRREINGITFNFSVIQ